MQIHPTAIVDPTSQLSPDVHVGPYSLVGADVKIGPRTWIGPYVLLEGPLEIGADCRIFSHSAIGTDAQDLKFRGERAYLRIGDRNRIREFVTVNRGTEAGGGLTAIGNDNYLMTGVHIAHDCMLGSGIILANAATLAGHVTVDDCATVGAFSGVHQFCRIGKYAYVGGYSVVTRDALPFVKTVGNRNDAKTYGLNTIGLERKGFDKDSLTALKRAYKILVQSHITLREAMEQLKDAFPDNPNVRTLLEFAGGSERGFIR